MTVHHPAPKILAAHLRTIAKLLDDHGTTAVNLAPLLAARGWPTTTGGDGSRSADTTSSTERAAGVTREAQRPGHWDGVDQRLHQQLNLLWLSSLQAQTTITDVVAHASDDDTLIAGAGPCLTCSHVCRPDDNPTDRLRSGLCPACNQAWIRWRNDHRGDRPAFLIWRREQTKILESRLKERHRPGYGADRQQSRGSLT